MAKCWSGMVLQAAYQDVCELMQVGSDAHARLLRALWSDTAFLAGLGVMDYSLLVGMDKSNGTLVVGIIDFIRQANCSFIHSAGKVQAIASCPSDQQFILV